MAGVKAGQKVAESTGALRHDATGKGRFDLLPYHAILRYARHMENGVTEGGYEPGNWRRGISVSRCISSALRHTFQYLEGFKDEDHLAAAIWNLCAIAHFEATMPAVCDLPRHKEQGG